MNVVGLVVEYNPLHNGHLYHFEQAIKATNADAVVIIMSGNFLQRGEPALVNKWARTQMALEMGVDLVIELPYVYATQQAQHFAFGAVQLLHQLPFVTHLCFGSESGEVHSFQQIAKYIANEPESFSKIIKANMDEGSSYPNAYGNALKQYLNQNNLDPTLSTEPNNILGLHYVTALQQLNSSIQPTTIKREKAAYHEEKFLDHQIASATAIRKALFTNQIPNWEEISPFLPDFTLNILKNEYQTGRGLVKWAHFDQLVRHALLSQSSDHLRSIYEVEEGIEFRLHEKAKEAVSIEQLCQLVKTKRYTWNRIQRMLLHVFTQCSKQAIHTLGLETGPQYIRLLGFSTQGQALLNQHKKSIGLPLISSIRRDHPPMLEWDIKGSLLHTLAYTKEAQMTEKNRELLQPPLRFP